MKINKIICPACQTQQSFTSYEMIQFDELVTLAPFQFHCKNCDYKNSVLYQTLVYDADKNVLLYLWPPTEKRNDELLEKGQLMLDQDDTIISRTVTSENALYEKFLIAQSELDDYLVELVKVESRHFIKQQDPDLTIEHMLLNRDSEGFFMTCFLEGGNQITLEVDPEVFVIAKRKYGPHLKEIEVNPFAIIDYQWASDFLDKYLKLAA